MEKILLSITGMTCKHCAAHVEEALLRVDGVKKVKVDLKAQTATVTASGAERASLVQAVKSEGYGAE